MHTSSGLVPKSWFRIGDTATDVDEFEDLPLETPGPVSADPDFFSEAAWDWDQDTFEDLPLEGTESVSASPGDSEQTTADTDEPQASPAQGFFVEEEPWSSGATPSGSSVPAGPVSSQRSPVSSESGFGSPRAASEERAEPFSGSPPEEAPQQQVLVAVEPSPPEEVATPRGQRLDRPRELPSAHSHPKGTGFEGGEKPRTGERRGQQKATREREQGKAGLRGLGGSNPVLKKYPPTSGKERFSVLDAVGTKKQAAFEKQQQLCRGGRFKWDEAMRVNWRVRTKVVSVDPVTAQPRCWWASSFEIFFRAFDAGSAAGEWDSVSGKLLLPPKRSELLERDIGRSCQESCAVDMGFLAQDAVYDEELSTPTAEQLVHKSTTVFEGSVPYGQSILARTRKLNNLLVFTGHLKENAPRVRGDEGLLEQWLYKARHSVGAGRSLRASSQRFYATSVVHGWWDASSEKQPFVMVTVTSQRIVVRYHPSLEREVTGDMQLLRRVHAWVRKRVPFIAPASFGREDGDLLVLERMDAFDQWRPLVASLKEDFGRRAVASKGKVWAAKRPFETDAQFSLYFDKLMGCGVWFAYWGLAAAYEVASVDEALEYLMIYGGPAMHEISPQKRFHCPGSEATATPQLISWSWLFGSVAEEETFRGIPLQTEDRVRARVVFTARSLSALYNEVRQLAFSGGGEAAQSLPAFLAEASDGASLFSELDFASGYSASGGFTLFTMKRAWRVVAAAFDPGLKDVIENMAFRLTARRVGFSSEAVADFYSWIFGAADTGGLTKNQLANLDRAFSPVALVRSEIQQKENAVDCLTEVINLRTTCRRIVSLEGIMGIHIHKKSIANFEKRLLEGKQVLSPTVSLPFMKHVLFTIHPSTFASFVRSGTNETLSESLVSQVNRSVAQNFLYVVAIAAGRQGLAGFSSSFPDYKEMETDRFKDRMEEFVREKVAGENTSWCDFWYTDNKNYFEQYVEPVRSELERTGGRAVIPVNITLMDLVSPPQLATVFVPGSSGISGHMLLFVLDGARRVVSLVDTNPPRVRLERGRVYWESSADGQTNSGWTHIQPLRYSACNGWEVLDLSWRRFNYLDAQCYLDYPEPTAGKFVLDFVGRDVAKKLGWTYHSGTNVCYDTLHESELFGIKRELDFISDLFYRLAALERADSSGPAEPAPANRTLTTKHPIFEKIDDLRRMYWTWEQLFNVTGECTNFSFVFATLVPIMGALAIDIPTLCFLLSFDSIFAFNFIRALLFATFFGSEGTKKALLRCMEPVKKLLSDSNVVEATQNREHDTAKSLDEIRQAYFTTLPTQCKRT